MYRQGDPFLFSLDRFYFELMHVLVYLGFLLFKKGAMSSLPGFTNLATNVSLILNMFQKLAFVYFLIVDTDMLKTST